MYVGFQIYPFMHMSQAMELQLDIPEILSMCAEIGYDGWECFLDQPNQVADHAEFLANIPLEMRSAYINLTLHDAYVSSSEISRALELVHAYQHFGIQYLVVNPSPIDWSGEQNKNDQQLTHQLKSLNTLAKQLSSSGVNLAYHTHSSEMRAGAKEQFHMLLNTDPQHVSWCIDCDWIYLGSDNSALSVYDWLKMFGKRVSMIHIRQIQDGVRNQKIESGDIDYVHVQRLIEDNGNEPLIINEQITGDPIAAYHDMKNNYKDSLAAMNAIFSP